MYKILLFFLSIICMSIGLFFIILYLNLFTLGYSFFDFVKFIIMRVECLVFFVGIILLFLSIGRLVRNELLLRRTNKYERRKSF